MAMLMGKSYETLRPAGAKESYSEKLLKVS